MARAGVVYGHIGRRLQPGAQNVTGFADEAFLFVGQQALHLAFRDGHADRLQQRHQPGQRRLPLMILHQHEAAEFGAEMAIDPLRQRGQDGASVRRDPAFALVKCGAGRNHQVLHQKRLVALEARAFRHGRGFHHPVLNDDPGRHLAAPPRLLLLGGLGRLRSLVHAARFDGGAAFQAFQTGDLVALFGNNLFQGRNFAEQLNQQSLKLCTAQIGEGGWRRHIRTESDRFEPGQAKNAGWPTFLPLLRRTASW